MIKLQWQYFCKPIFCTENTFFKPVTFKVTVKKSLKIYPAMKQKKGFAAMTPEQRKEIASTGGKAAHAKGKAYRFNSESAKTAGKKGGKTVSENKEHMAAIGKKGGEARSKNKGLTRINDMIMKYEAEQKKNSS